MTMKGILFGLLAFCALPFADQASAAEVGTLTVYVTGIRSDQGVIRAGVFNSPATYAEKAPNAESAFARVRLSIKDGKAIWQLKEVPYGVYAIKLYHDEDNSGKLKRSFVGRPTEGVGFSNNPKLANHAPTFDEVKFTVNQPKTDITIKMINP